MLKTFQRATPLLLSIFLLSLASGCIFVLNNSSPIREPTATKANSPPVFPAVSTQSVDQGKSVTIALAATDPDGGDLQYSITSSPAEGSATLTGSSLTYTAASVTSGSDSVTVLVRDAKGSEVSQTINFRIRYLSWIGGVGVGSAWTTGGTAVGSEGDGMLRSGGGGFFVDSVGDALFGTDERSRLVKWTYSTGNYIGWAGYVAAIPTGGGVACTLLSFFNLTTSFCTGGMGTSGSSVNNPLYFDGTWLYSAAGWEGRILRINPATGVIDSWIGKVATTPTGGAGGCAATPVGNITPGWCSGGASQTGSEFGAFGFIHGLTGDATNLYILENNKYRLQKVNIATGVATGWIGRIDTVPTGEGLGGPGTCTVTASGSVTPGWCTGGTSQITSTQVDGTADGLGGFWNPYGVYVDATDIYVNDEGRILRYDLASGTFTGWLGMVSSVSPTGGDAGCAALAANAYTKTQRWCLGGATMSSYYGGSNEGTVGNGPITGDATYLYIQDPARIQRINKNGTAGGWAGRISTVPTGDAPGGAGGCAAASVLSVTPGWCTGGYWTNGNGDGMFGSNGAYAEVQPRVANIQIVGPHLIVGDTGQGRIQRFNLATGAFVDWIGGKSTEYAGWRTEDAYTSGAPNDYSFKDPVGVHSSGGFLYVTETTAWRAKKINATTGALVGWIGKVLEVPTGGVAGCTATAVGGTNPGWCTGGRATPGRQNGQLYIPGDAYVYGSILYIMDRGHPNIAKFSVDDGSFLGWTGRIAVVPTGGIAGCTTAGVGDITPGWCTGGEPNWGAASGDGMMGTILRLTGDGTYLYVVDAEKNRVLRYSIATGAFSGWIGYISGSATTSGDAGCAGAINQVTPGWCYGGESAASSALGGFSYPTCIATYGDDLVIADMNNRRLSRFNKNTGILTGWVGSVNATPTGGVAGCTALVANNFTPGWCTGGSSQPVGNHQEFTRPWGMAMDADGIYIVDYGEISRYRVTKFNTTTGAYVGWKGKIYLSPTGGDTGCNGAAISSITPGWCTGGSAIGGYENGAIGTFPWGGFSGVGIDSDYVYIADPTLQRITRITK